MMKKTKLILPVILFLVLSFTLFVFAKEDDKEVLLHFIHVSDTHLQKEAANDGHRLKKSSGKLISKMFEQINGIPNVDFVLHTGDIVDQPTEELVNRFFEIAMSLKYPMYATLGNHDVGVNVEVDKEEFIKRFNTLKNATSFTNGMTYYSFSPTDDFTFIVLDGTTEKEITSNGTFDDKQFEWLKKELEKNKDKYIIIAIHYPLIEPFKSKTHRFLEPWQTKLLDLINSYKNVVGVFTGHYHAARLVKIKNKIHNSCPAIIQYPIAFREVTVRKDEKEKYLYLDFKWHEINEPELRKMSKELSNGSWKLSEGAKEDREQVMKFKIY